MFERFTERARRVVVLAQEEARLLNHNYIGTEHVLLGLLHEGEGVAAKALEQMGISLDAVRERVEDMIGQGGSSPTGHIPFTPRAKKVLELALREALQLGHNYIGTEHILLGLVREGEGVAAQVLAQMGADLNRVRHAAIQLLSGYGGQSPDAAGPVLGFDDLGTGIVGRRLRLRVMGGRITISIDDPANNALPELDLVVRNPDLTPEDSRAIYATVRSLVRQLDQRLADLEPHIAFDDPLPPPAAAAEAPD